MASRQKAECIALSGLDDADLAASTGFTRRAWAALVHLREAWISADPSNARAIELAIAALLTGHSFADNLDTVERILRAHHERGDELMGAIAIVDRPKPKTGAERYFDERMKDPSFARGVERAREEIRRADEEEPKP
jgi:hypothetical protein